MEELLPNRLDELLAKHLAQEATPAEQQEVEAWLASDPTHQQYYDSLVQVWNETAAVSMTELAAIDAGWNHLKGRISTPAQPSGTIVAFRRYGWQIAAAIGFLLVVGMSLWRFLPHERTDTPADYLVYDATDGPKEISLLDGSKVILRQGAKLRVPLAFGTANRSLSLAGTAFFEVEADSLHPFSVQGDLGQVKVLGTQFEMLTDADSLQVSVAEGLVVVAIPQVATIRLRQQEGLRYAKVDSMPPQPEVLDANALSGYTRSFTFQNQSLIEVVEQLRKVYQEDIIIRSPQIEHCPINTSFEQASLPYILDVLKNLHEISWEKEGAVYVISGQGCEE